MRNIFKQIMFAFKPFRKSDDAKIIIIKKGDATKVQIEGSDMNLFVAMHNAMSKSKGIETLLHEGVHLHLMFDEVADEKGNVDLADLITQVIREEKLSKQADKESTIKN